MRKSVNLHITVLVKLRCEFSSRIHTCGKSRNQLIEKLFRNSSVDYI